MVFLPAMRLRPALLPTSPTKFAVTVQSTGWPRGTKFQDTPQPGKRFSSMYIWKNQLRCYNKFDYELCANSGLETGEK